MAFHEPDDKRARAIVIKPQLTLEASAVAALDSVTFCPPFVSVTVQVPPSSIIPGTKPRISASGVAIAELIIGVTDFFVPLVGGVVGVAEG